MADVDPSIFGPAPRRGGRFHNLVADPSRGNRSALRWFLTRKPGPWPKRVEGPIGPKPVDRVTDNSIRATLIGQATALIQVAGLNILTDPVWSERASPVQWAGPKRVRPPAVNFDDLPPIDAVLLSHSHYDHLDRAALLNLYARHKMPVVTGLKVGRVIPEIPVVECDWWQCHALSDRVAATYVPAQHFSARTPFDRNVTLWGGFVLQTPAGTIYFSGDTGAGPHIAAIAERFGPMALSLLPVGAYLPRWIMAPVHMDPHEAVAAADILQSRVTLPIHHSTIPLADDAYDEPLRVLNEALAGRTHGWLIPEFGEAVVIP
jgi:L-ascorbate metabolism protein UlaG (beta-lactamase superfamily)